MKKTKTVTIGIPAHNEALNITRLINSIAAQKGNNFKINKAIVMCDGCTDNTSGVAKKLSKKFTFVKVIDDGQRLGKIGRLNQLYKKNKSDILIIVDGDTVLGSRYTIFEFVNAFSDKKVGLVGGNDRPGTPHNFVQKMASTWIDIWYYSHKDVNNGVTINNHKGCASALSKSLAKRIQIPKQIVVGDEDYVYLKSKELGYKFKFAEQAVVNYSVPSTINEFFRQTTRFLSTKNNIADYFGEYVYEEFKIPLFNKFKGVITVFIKEPYYVFIAIIFQILQRIASPFYQDSYQGGFWQTLQTTK